MFDPVLLKKSVSGAPMFEARTTTGWHGTDTASAKDIIDNGFNVSKTSTKGWLGQGVYFYQDYSGQTMSSRSAAHKFAERHRNANPPVVIESNLNFNKYLDLDGLNCTFYNDLRDKIVDSLTKEELSEIDSRIENFILACMRHLWPESCNMDGVGCYFDGTPAPGFGHAMLAVRKTVCILTRTLLS